VVLSDPPLRRQLLRPLRPSASTRSDRSDHGDHWTKEGTQGAKDLLDYVLNERPLPLELTTYDLGAIALYRFEMAAPACAQRDIVLCYSEVASFDTAWQTANRRKVHLADGCAQGVALGRPFGVRGCRYLHVLSTRPASSSHLSGREAIKVQVWRRTYPLVWRTGVQSRERGDEAILQACRATLVAVCDGGLVDTCWRERAQWTGDVRMSAMAIRSLTTNTEVVSLALTQIAATYDRQVAMVSGYGPARTATHHLPMPTYHLAFCLAVLEHHAFLRHHQRPPPVSSASPSSTDPAVAATLSAATAKAASTELDAFETACLPVVHQSVRAWRDKYLFDGILCRLPGWNFCDWDLTVPNADAIGQQRAGVLNGPHAVCHAWWHELCQRLLTVPGPARTDSNADHADTDTEGHASMSGLHATRVDRAFWVERDGGYSLLPRQSAASPHATAAMLGSGLAPPHRQAAAHAYLRAQIRSGQVAARVTPYFAYFVAQALGRRSHDDAVRFVRQYYGPIAAQHGTMREKVSDGASLAHGWSVAIASMLV